MNLLNNQTMASKASEVFSTMVINGLNDAICSTLSNVLEHMNDAETVSDCREIVEKMIFDTTIKTASLTTEEENIEDSCKLFDASFKKKFDECFKKELKGYHRINQPPVKEAIWENILAMILKTLKVNILSESNGSHSSGMDIDCSLGSFSNKSSKYNRNKDFDISSYRLHTVCNEVSCGSQTKIIEEINKRKNFDYYAIVVRDETDKKNIRYDCLMIPSNYRIFDPASYTWEPTIGRTKKQMGWNTNVINGCRMKITFSMSSQLWIHIKMTEELKKFIVASAVVENKQTLKYSKVNELFDLLESVVENKQIWNHSKVKELFDLLKSVVENKQKLDDIELTE
jgi:hypothetical protein